MSEGQARRRGGRRTRDGGGEASAPAGQAPAAGATAGDGGAAGPGPTAREADGVHDGAGPTPPPPGGGSARAEAGGGAGAPHVDRSVCLCAGLGPMLTQALRTLSVPDEVKHSLHETEREALRLLRMLIEARLSSLGGDEGRPREPARGVKLDVS